MGSRTDFAVHAGPEGSALGYEEWQPAPASHAPPPFVTFVAFVVNHEGRTANEAECQVSFATAP